MIIAQVCLRLATIKDHSKMCSFEVRKSCIQSQSEVFRPRSESLTASLMGTQWCSLRDTQVYAVYPLGKVKDLRIPTSKSMRIRNNIVL